MEGREGGGMGQGSWDENVLKWGCGEGCTTPNILKFTGFPNKKKRNIRDHHLARMVTHKGMSWTASSVSPKFWNSMEWSSPGEGCQQRGHHTATKRISLLSNQTRLPCTTSTWIKTAGRGCQSKAIKNELILCQRWMTSEAHTKDPSRKRGIKEHGKGVYMNGEGFPQPRGNGNTILPRWTGPLSREWSGASCVRRDLCWRVTVSFLFS